MSLFSCSARIKCTIYLENGSIELEATQNIKCSYHKLTHHPSHNLVNIRNSNAKEGHKTWGCICKIFRKAKKHFSPHLLLGKIMCMITIDSVQMQNLLWKPTCFCWLNVFLDFGPSFCWKKKLSELYLIQEERADCQQNISLGNLSLQLFQIHNFWFSLCQFIPAQYLE